MSNYIPFVVLPIVFWGVWHHLKKNSDLTALKKRTFLIAAIAFTVTEMGRSFYRPYIYSHNIDDYFIADTLGNSFGTVTAIFMILTLSGSGTKRDWRLVGIVVLGLLLYEFISSNQDTSFDMNDIIATLLFGSISAFLYLWILRKHGR